ncbi:MAG: flagella synthesis protein FlgN [Bradyrhizobium sp.]|uniref:flagella synthesis protein FlgN n=1 Tax=Bradyrhizobium sp. TaxID=376 RepID=UPI003D14D023
MLQNPVLHKLEACLQREIQAGGQLLEALRREHRALAARDLAGLDAAVVQKAGLVAVMEDCGRERSELLRAAGFAADRAAMDALLDRHDPQRRSPVPRDWSRLLEIGAECQRQNLINGIIIQAGQQQTRQALAILRGQPAVAGGEYGPEGTRRTAPSAHPLAKA